MEKILIVAARFIKKPILWVVALLAALLSYSLTPSPSYSQSGSRVQQTEITSSTSPYKPSYWLVLWSLGTGAVMEKIEMISMEQCEMQGNIWKKKTSYHTFLCLEGK